MNDEGEEEEEDEEGKRKRENVHILQRITPLDLFFPRPPFRRVLSPWSGRF